MSQIIIIDNIFANNKNHKNIILTRIISDHQMTCCILPNNNNAVQWVNRGYIEVENIHEKTLEQLKNKLQNTNLYEKINHDIYANPNMNYQILINA